MKKILFKKFKEGKGFTLIETLIAVVILALVSLMMVEGVRMALVAYGVNKTKTEASAIANEEIEKIRSLIFSDIGIKNGDPGFEDGDPVGILDSHKDTAGGYSVDYSVTWVEETKRTKQIKVSVFKTPMKNKIEVITEITLLGEILTSESPTTNYPPPHDLKIDSDTGNGANRVVVLSWQSPENPSLPITNYKIYRDGSSIGTSQSNSYADTPGNNSSHTYYVTAVYSDNKESVKSNEVTAK